MYLYKDRYGNVTGKDWVVTERFWQNSFCNSTTTVKYKWRRKWIYKGAKPDSKIPTRNDIFEAVQVTINMVLEEGIQLIQQLIEIDNGECLLILIDFHSLLTNFK